jgi:hypothetical protein
MSSSASRDGGAAVLAPALSSSSATAVSSTDRMVSLRKLVRATARGAARPPVSAEQPRVFISSSSCCVRRLICRELTRGIFYIEYAPDLTAVRREK